MRLLSKALKALRLAAILAAGIGACALDQAKAASPLELNFWLSGPRYDGRVGPCEWALPTIATQFWDKESNYWNSALKITGFSNIHEIAFRPWQSDNIPRRYCTGQAILNDGKARQVNFSLIEDGGYAGFGEGVEWCVVGLDRDWAFNPACKAAGP